MRFILFFITCLIIDIHLTGCAHKHTYSVPRNEGQLESIKSQKMSVNEFISSTKTDDNDVFDIRIADSLVKIRGSGHIDSGIPNELKKIDVPVKAKKDPVMLTSVVVGVAIGGIIGASQPAENTYLKGLPRFKNTCAGILAGGVAGLIVGEIIIQTLDQPDTPVFNFRSAKSKHLIY